nr:helicase-like transcription factor CHR28 isoform X1 [Ipomoea batatas]
MVAACHVILLDLWWNPTTEDQAIDRAHRIGQTRPVTVSRLTIQDTVEDRILALQVYPYFRKTREPWLHLLLVKIMQEALQVASL